MSEPASENEDRRRHQRFRGNLSILIHKTGLGGIFHKPAPARCEDFSISGAQIVTSDKFKIGQKLVVDLALRDLYLEELNAVVCSMHEEGDKYRYGIRFNFDSGAHMRSSVVSHCLRNIANSLQQDEVYDKPEA